MIGDSNSDIEFGHNAGMHTILIGDEATKSIADDRFDSLIQFAKTLK